MFLFPEVLAEANLISNLKKGSCGILSLSYPQRRYGLGFDL